MDSAIQSYRLEVAVKRVYGLAPLIASTASKIAVEVHFLNFPAIVVQPQNFAVGDTVTYNVCHKADFRMTAAQMVSIFPAVCQCNLFAEGDPSFSEKARWSCPCILLPNTSSSSSAAQRTYANCVIRSTTTGETLGYAEMSCTVVCLAPPAAPTSQQQQQTWPVSYAPPSHPSPSSSLQQEQQQSQQQQQPPASLNTRKPDGECEQGKPYIVRVIVGDSGRRRRDCGHHDRRCSKEANVSGRELTSASAAHHDGTSSGRHGSSVPRVSANTASKESLLYVLQYDVAYQLQSLSETIAAVLRREYQTLNATPLSGGRNDGSVNIAKLTKSIDRSVAQMVKLANIVLQVVNQLIDNSPAPACVGTSREIKDMARQKRNPVNRLPAPTDGSVSHYLQYDVLYQLQCLGTNLAYVILAYREVLGTPLSAIPKQHAEFCSTLGDEVQHLTKLLNVLIQSSVDGVLGISVPPGSATATPAKANREQKKKRRKSKRRDTAAVTAKLSARALSISEEKSSRSISRNTNSSSYFSSTQSSRSSASGSSSSTSSSSNSSLNQPVTPASAPPGPVAFPAVAASPASAVPNVPSKHLQVAPQSYAPPPLPPPVAAPVSVPHSQPQPHASPPPYTTVASLQPIFAAATPPTSETSLQESSNSFLSVPGATPFSWVNAMQRNQQNGSLTTSPLSTSVTPQTSGALGSTGATLTTQPAMPPQVSVSPPRLSRPSPLAPPMAIAPPASHAAPTPAVMAPPLPPPPLAPAAIPIPVPIPQ